MQTENIYQTENYKGFTINIVNDDDAQNPRTEQDNMGTMVCWHSRYDLGDMDGNTPISKQYSDPDNLFAEIAGIDIDSNYCTRIYDKQGQAALSQYLYNAACKKAIILPLYLYDHSGITMRTGTFSDIWDSGRVGYIYITLEHIRKEYNVKAITKQIKEKAIACLNAEVDVYDNYLTGEVYGFDVCNNEGESLDSCWGYYGDTSIKDAIIEAKSTIDYHISQMIKAHTDKVKQWITNKVPLIYRTALNIA